jgi:hypothetical protein
MSGMSSEPPPPSPLDEAAEGFVELAKWFTTLVRDHALEVADRVETADETDGGFGVAGATGALARMAALPLLGWAGLVNEMVDVAAIFTRRLRRKADIASEPFTAEPTEGPRVLDLGEEPFANGFGQGLVADSIEIVPMRLEDGEAAFRLEARGVSPECVGVYKGTVKVMKDQGPRDPLKVLDVWVVVPAPTQARDL